VGSLVVGTVAFLLWERTMGRGHGKPAPAADGSLA
jgi:hypothetical protein